VLGGAGRLDSAGRRGRGRAGLLGLAGSRLRRRGGVCRWRGYICTAVRRTAAAVGDRLPGDGFPGSCLPGGCLGGRGLAGERLLEPANDRRLDRR